MLTDTIDIDSNIQTSKRGSNKVIAPETQRKNFYVLVLGEVKNPGKFLLQKTVLDYLM